MSRRPHDLDTLKALHRSGQLAGAVVPLRDAPSPELWQWLESRSPEALPARIKWRSAWDSCNVEAWPEAKCTSCERQMWDADNNPDPRGAMGDRLPSSLIAEEYGQTGPDVALFYLCGNDYGSYKAALARAHAQWTPAPDPTPELELEDTTP